ncbi:MAG: hypothetical protein K6T16_00515 [Candidatus Pacearchaeota archaeon]|nr:hypothetical protein [Candidatus Pacearchaeota archaeon]
MIDNKKAGIFAVGLFLGMVIFMGLSWSVFSKTNQYIKESFTGISFDYQDNLADRYSLYINESKELAASQALYWLSRNAAIDTLNPSCKIFGEHIIWSTDCKPTKEFIETRFIEEYNKSFYNFAKKYPKAVLADIEYSHSFEENGLSIIRSDAEEKEITLIEKTAFATYNISYEFNPSTSFNLAEHEINLNDFELIYTDALGALDTCKSNENIANCIKTKINFERWNVEGKKEGSYLLFYLQTKKYFFFEQDGIEKFGPISLNFALAV